MKMMESKTNSNNSIGLTNHAYHVLSYTAMMQAKEFYKNPENKAAFEAWQKEREEKKKMKSSWRVRTKEVAGITFYRVFRYRDMNSPERYPEIEVYGGLWGSRIEAEILAQRLNEEGKL